ncbi:bifunctional DNA-formamidopyrimidine glycosylase/DNA-(apurinic or apyrimidinic site) lyase [Roseateles sp. BYS180W]|uniref:Formamidopyrimidine-DNA glycosylase n=1 Tax=Roseateles rivi TaxID=3299028 RepID=A0ABW7FXA1_9BURK
MPELPEVEITRQSFAQALCGARVLEARLGKPLRWPLGVAPEALQGSVLGLAQRRGKYIWLPLLAGQSGLEGGLLLHLGMSGSLGLTRERPAPGVHDHFDLWTDRGLLRLHDPRRFGAVVWSRALDAAPAATLLARLGLEPFDPRLDGRYLKQALAGRRVAIKQALLAGDVVVGAGNIYACEALFLAGIDPRLPAHKLSPARCDRLVAAVRDVLGRALNAGGSTLRDFRDAHGVAGSFQMLAQVYDREGQPCRVCTTPLRRIVQGQRSTYYCPKCQKK